MKKIILLVALMATTLTLAGCAEVRAPGSSTGGSNTEKPGNSTMGFGTSGTTAQPDGTTEGIYLGPTEAPDLISVGGFQEGPTTPQGNPTTLVDFEFDQAAYLKSGDRTNFHLARTSGKDALDATSMTPEGDKEGDDLVKAVFPGELNAKDFARGYVDSQILTSRDQGANRYNPSNINQAATIGDGETENPDLVSVTRDGDRLLYEFDEPLTGDDVIQNTGGLRIYFAKSDGGTIREAGTISVKRRDQTTLDAFFGRDLPGDRTLEDAAGAFVKQGAVQAAEGSRGGSDGKNAFDGLSPVD